MSYPQWNSFTYYTVGSQVQDGSAFIYIALIANVNIPTSNATYWAGNVPTSAGVNSVNGIGTTTNGGIITLTSPNGAYTANATTGVIDFVVNIPPATGGITSLNGLDYNNNGGVLAITSADSTVTITPDAITGNIDLSVSAASGGIVSLNGLNNTSNGGVLSLTSANTTITIAPDSATGNIDLAVPSSGVVSLNGLEVATTGTGQLQLTSITEEIVITPSTLTGAIDLSYKPGSLVKAILVGADTVAGAVAFSSPNSTINVGYSASGNAITFDTASVGITSLNGLDSTSNAGVLAITSADSTVTITPDSATGNIDLSVSAASGGIVSMNGLDNTSNKGVLAITSADSTVTITPDPDTGNIDLSVLTVSTGITSLNGLNSTSNGGVLAITSTSGDITITPTALGGTIDLAFTSPVPVPVFGKATPAGGDIGNPYFEIALTGATASSTVVASISVQDGVPNALLSASTGSDTLYFSLSTAIPLETILEISYIVYL